MTAQIIPFPTRRARPPATTRQRLIDFLEGEGLTPLAFTQLSPAHARELVKKWRLTNAKG